MELIYLKEVDKSLLYQGFTIRTALLDSFLDLFGKLDIGEMRQISILLNGKIYSGIKVINQNFDMIKYPDHPEMYQVRYDNIHGFLQALRCEFSDLYNFINEQMQIKKKMMKERGEITPNIKIPQELKSSLSFYTTDNPNVWEAVSITSSDYIETKMQLSELAITEKNFEDMLLTDNNATIVQENHFIKVRKLDRNVCLNLKRLYYRCQICGQLISAPYGDKPVVDAHHIDFFTQSLNNNYNNVIILCPNHHRVVHTYQPLFKRQTKFFEYPNGYKEKVLLNFHL